jgi:solute carrier family 25 citrate transporter 1
VSTLALRNSDNLLILICPYSFVCTISSPWKHPFFFGADFAGWFAGLLLASVSGGITGGIEISITYPTEFLKTKMQLYKEYSQKGVVYSIKTTYQQHGIKGFYRGLPVLLFFSVPKTGVRFGANQFLKNNIFTDFKTNKLSNFLAGVGAGIAEAIFVVTPQETLKTKLIHDRFQPNPQYKGLFDGVQKIYAAQGFAGVYRGVVPTILRQGSNQGVRFLVYEETKTFLVKQFAADPTSVGVTFLSGGIAGAASVFANTPVDVVKTQMQGLDAKKYKNGLDCFFQTLKNEGIRGLYKGTVPRLSRVVLDVALTFTLYENISRLLNKII